MNLGGFTRYLQENGLAKRSIETLTSRLRILEQKCHPLNRDTFFDFLLEYEQEYTKAATNKYIQAARHYCKFMGQEWGSELKQRVEDIRTPDTFTLDEVKQFFSLECGLPRKLRAFTMWTTLFRTMYLTGMRPQELWKLKTNDVDWNRKLFRVRGTKTSLDRDLPIPDILLPEIRAQAGLEYLFCKDDGGKLNSNLIWTVFSRRLKRAGLVNKSPYSFRHTFATNLANNEVGIYDIKILMGHTKISTTERYLHTSYKKLHKAVRNHSEVRNSLEAEDKFKLLIDDIKKSGILDADGIDYSITNDSITVKIQGKQEHNYSLAVAA